MIANALKAHAAGNKREWKTDRSQTIGASEIGMCARRVFFDKNEGDPVYGVSRDPDFEERWGARARGSAYEAVTCEGSGLLCARTRFSRCCTQTEPLVCCQEKQDAGIHWIRPFSVLRSDQYALK